MRRTTWYRWALLALAAFALTSACAVSGLSFVADTRVEIVVPAENAEVALPFELAWTVEDFDGSFAVFFDRSPMRPGQGLRSLVPDGDPCRAERDCPDADWLAEREIYVTDTNHLVVDSLPDRRDTDRSKDRHDVTIVLLDQHGNRSGEAAFTREFIVERER